MSYLQDETKEPLSFLLIALAGVLQVLNGIQDGSTWFTVAGGMLAAVAIGFLVIRTDVLR